MSLVVARTFEKQLAVIADTKITCLESDPRSIKPDHRDGVIKIMILNKNLSVAFAGQIEYAETAIKEVGPEDSVGKILEVLLKAHQASRGLTAFLLLVGQPSPTIYAIKDNKVESGASAWIGDKKGFNRFQEGMNNPKPQFEQTGCRFDSNLSTELFIKMSAAMDYVIADGTIPSVVDTK